MMLANGFQRLRRGPAATADRRRYTSSRCFVAAPPHAFRYAVDEPATREPKIQCSFTVCRRATMPLYAARRCHLLRQKEPPYKRSIKRRCEAATVRACTNEASNATQSLPEREGRFESQSVVCRANDIAPFLRPARFDIAPPCRRQHAAAASVTPPRATPLNKVSMLLRSNRDPMRSRSAQQRGAPRVRAITSARRRDARGARDARDAQHAPRARFISLRLRYTCRAACAVRRKVLSRRQDHEEVQ